VLVLRQEGRKATGPSEEISGGETGPCVGEKTIKTQCLRPWLTKGRPRSGG